MSMKSTFPLIAFKSTYTGSFDLTVNTHQYNISIAGSDVHMYGSAANGAAASGTLIHTIAGLIDTAISADSANFPSYVSTTPVWLHNPTSNSLLWQISINIGEAVDTADTYIEEASGDLRQIGLYLNGTQYSGSVAGNIVTFTGQFTPGGVWAPCMPNELRSPDREYVLKTARNPRSPANFSRIQHAQTTYQNVTWTDVSGFYRDDFRQSQSHYQDQAGFDLPEDPAVPTLETMLNAWAGGADLQLWTDAGAYLDVDLTKGDTFRVSSFASPGSAGGSRFTVEMEFIEV